MVEAVIMLPVLGILLLGTSFVRERALARQQALLEARRCAWEFALAGCDPERVPQSCKRAPRQGQSEEGAQKSQDLMGRLDESHNGFNPLDDVPVLGAAMRALFGSTTTASRSIEVPSPWTPGARFAAGGEITVACNEKPREVLDVVQDAVGAKLPKVKP
jgi:hypothetical protein